MTRPLNIRGVSHRLEKVRATGRQTFRASQCVFPFDWSKWEYYSEQFVFGGAVPLGARRFLLTLNGP
jgi:hypothetical protein